MQRFVQQRATKLDALDEKIIETVDDAGEIWAAELRKFDDLEALPKSTYYARLRSLGRGGFIEVVYERRMILRSIVA